MTVTSVSTCLSVLRRSKSSVAVSRMMLRYLIMTLANDRSSVALISSDSVRYTISASRSMHSCLG